MRKTIAGTFPPNSQPFVDDVEEDRRKVDRPGFPPRLPSKGRRADKRSRVLLGALIVVLEQDRVIPCRIENVSDGGPASSCVKDALFRQSSG